MNDAFIGVLIGAFVTLLGTLLAHWREQRKRRSEEERWYGQFFLQRKFDALSRLHEALVDCRFALGVPPRPEEGPPETFRARIFDAYEGSLQAKQDALIRARVVASIYLAAEENEQIGLAVDGYVAAVDGIRTRIGGHLRGPGGQFVWLSIEESKKFFEGFKPAAECLKRLLAPPFPGLEVSKRGTKRAQSTP